MAAQTSLTERQEIYRLRYKIYHEEMNIEPISVDHEKQLYILAAPLTTQKSFAALAGFQPSQPGHGQETGPSDFILSSTKTKFT